MPTDDVRKLIARRSPEWREHQLRWRWLLDSYEGGDRYRYAVYGQDRRGMPVYNLIRHKREYPEPGADTTPVLPSPMLDQAIAAMQGEVGPRVSATDDDFTLRLVRTPVPDFMSEVVRKWLGKVYRHEVERQGPQPYLDWIQDIDGTGTSLDEWMRCTVAPLLLAIGTLDVLMDHPQPPEDATVETMADFQALDLGSVVARLVMPWDVLWWRLDVRGRYSEVLIREYEEDEYGGVGEVYYRHWTSLGWTLYDCHGEIEQAGEHPFGRVPMTRLLFQPRASCRMAGTTPLETVAERQREYYNRDSELILSDTLQAHPLLQGPEDIVDDNGSIAIGPGWLLPKKKSMAGGQVSYEGFEAVDFGKGGADSIRQNLEKLRAEIENATALVKPAGSDSGTVSQSGLSKGFDYQALNETLGQVADRLSQAERQMGELALLVAGDGAEPEPGVIEVAYSRQFELRTGDELAASLAQFQDVLASAGRLPEVETRVLMAIVRDDLLPGLDDATYATFEDEIRSAIEESSTERKAGIMNAMAAATGVDPNADPSLNDPMNDPMANGDPNADPNLA